MIADQLVAAQAQQARVQAQQVKAQAQQDKAQARTNLVEVREYRTPRITRRTPIRDWNGWSLQVQTQTDGHVNLGRTAGRSGHDRRSVAASRWKPLKGQGHRYLDKSLDRRTFFRACLSSETGVHPAGSRVGEAVSMHPGHRIRAVDVRLGLAGGPLRPRRGQPPGHRVCRYGSIQRRVWGVPARSAPT